MSTTRAEYNNLKVRGPISIRCVTPEDVKGESLLVYLLMGPTGSGKSAFIESLSPGHKLDISKDSLESVTQDVVCYRVVSLTCSGWNVILVDTPGFLDTKMSESRITKMITETLDGLCQSAASVAVIILYFQPITDIRMGGSKRDAVKLLRAFAESFEAEGISVVTTMWNQISSPEKMEDANHRLSNLQKEIFVESDTLIINVTQFEFSHGSALSILDKVWGGWTHRQDELQRISPQYQSLIHNNLLERISNTCQQLLTLADDKQSATTPGREDPLLLEVVLRDEKVALGALQSFLDDLYEIDPESCSSPFPQENVPQSPPPASPLSPPPPPFLSSSPFPPNKKSMSAHLKEHVRLEIQRCMLLQEPQNVRQMDDLSGEDKKWDKMALSGYWEVRINIIGFKVACKSDNHFPEHSKASESGQ
ncbi:hypothetical protein BJ165DRAFT_1567661 [Panaeolus papilionaceus]|nr:hypothetical protein BJ165DRAFT_1567661 [Panaeolus papilionaceus]